MKKLFSILLVLALAGCSSPAPAATPSAQPDAKPAQTSPITFWTLAALERDTPGSQPGSDTFAALHAARGETESFHVVLSSSTPVEITGFSVTDLTSPEGGVIPKDSMELFREHYVDVTASPVNYNSTTTKRETGMIPDGLIPLVNPMTGEPQSADARIKALPFTVTPEQRAAFFIDITVPRDAAPGEYRGEYEIRTAEGALTGEIRLTVWNFAIPETPRLKSSFYLDSGYQNAAPYIEILKCRLQPNVKRISGEGFDEGFTKLMTELKQYGLYMADLRIASGAYWQNPTMRSAPSREAIGKIAALYPPGLELYDYFADEITDFVHLFGKVKEWSAALREAGIKPLVVMVPKDAMFYEGGSPVLDYYVVLPQQFTENVGGVRRAQKAGAEVWSYNCVGWSYHGPIWFTDYPLINFRIQAGFMNAQADLTGLLYWALDYYVYGNPWEKTVGFIADGGGKDDIYAGDGQMVYPGKDVGYRGTIAPSLRLKALRDGVDDYDYYCMLKDAGLEDWTKEQMKPSAIHFDLWNADPKVLERARLSMGEKLNELYSSGQM